MMTNTEFFEMKAREAGFDLDRESERNFCSNLAQLVDEVIHGEGLLEQLYDNVDNGSVLSTEDYAYFEEEECFILFSLDYHRVFQVTYLLNQFGIELIYRNGEYRVYIKNSTRLPLIMIYIIVYFNRWCFLLKKSFFW